MKFFHKSLRSLFNIILLLAIMGLLVGLSRFGFCQPPQVVKAEYYFDSDPGSGNGTPVSITPNDTASFTGTLSFGSLSPGFHRIAFRAMDNLGRWGLPEGRLFYVFQTFPKSAKIVQAEYYFDTDPGVGNATNLPVSPNDTLTLTSLLPVISLSNGWHKVGLRTRDDQGKWTTREERDFFVGPCSTPVPDNVAGWWSMDDATTLDPTIPDLAGNQPGVFVNGPDFIPFNGIFDGLDDYVGMPDNDAWAFGNQDFTIELLANFASPGGTNTDPQDKIIGQSEGFGTAKKWTLSHWNNKMVFTVANGSAYTVDFGSNFSPTANQWYHLALTRAGDSLRMFANGVQIGQQIVPGLYIPDVNTPVTIGYVEWLHLGADPGNFAGSLDEVTLYKRALSQPEIASIAAAGKSGKCKVLSITTGQIPDGQFGHPYSYSFSAGFGLAPYKWTLVSSNLPSGITLDSNGFLSGTPQIAGDYSLNVRVKDQSNTTVQKSFVWQVLVIKPFSQFTIFKSGTTAVPGRNMDYFINVENVGNIQDTISIDETLEPWFLYRRSAPNGVISRYQQGVFSSNLADSIPHTITWGSILNSGTNIILTYRVKLWELTPLNELVTGGAKVKRGPGWDANVCDQECERANMPKALKDAAFCSKLRQNGWITTIEQEMECIRKVQDNFQDEYYECFKECAPPPPQPPPNLPPTSTYPSTTQAPIDPNEKLVLAPRYIKPDRLLVYPIHYENIGTIEAQDVFIRDTLSPFLDLKSLKILSPTGSSVDSLNRIVKWDLIGTNLQPDSSGYVLYSAKPKAGLPSGTILRNRAGIKFEVFQTYMTNETVNIIDGLAPKSSMKPLPDTLYQTAIPLKWSGVDSVGELKDYTIFVSVDGSGYTPFLRNTTDTSAWYLGQPGKTYRFICVAEDLAGNFEVQGLVAEATTYLKVLCASKYFRDADGDGYGSRFVYSYSCTPPTGFLADSLDCDDSRPEVHPGGTEACSLYDENCNGVNNENNVCVTAVQPKNAPLEGELILIPNPAAEQVRISITGPFQADCLVRIFDVEGREVFRETIGSGRHIEGVTVKTTRFQNGIYYVKAMMGKASQVRKLVILH